MRLGLMTPGLGYGDAIGVDVLGMFAECQKVSPNVFIFTPHGTSSTALPTYHYADTRWLLPNPDDLLIYHYGTWDPSALREMRRQKCRIAVKFHNVTPSKFMMPYSVEFSAATRHAYDDIGELLELPVELFLCDSEFNASELHALGAPKDRTITVPCFHSAEGLLHEKEDEVTLSQLRSHAFNILTVSRLVPNKNFEEMLACLDALVRQRRFFGCLHIVGSRDARLKAYTDDLDAYIADTSLARHVVFHGAVRPSTLATLYRHSDLYWTTSQHEGLGVPLIEAMAFGKPIMSSTKAALRETCGDVALYADTTDETVETLTKILEDDKALMLTGGPVEVGVTIEGG